ncbi:MAG: hypothetical protein ACYDGR_01605 [Candidatus Dormibacteria bacterium]
MTTFPRQPLTTGQAGEWLVWTHLALQSGGDLHVFLPALDRGIDGFVHRISTDTHTPVQVKARTATVGRRIAFELTGPELANPGIQVIVVQLDPETATLALAPRAPRSTSSAPRRTVSSSRTPRARKRRHAR